MKNIIVLGAGMVGRAMAIDLSTSHKVSVADISETSLKYIESKNNSISTIKIDISDSNILSKTIANFDLVICAVPGFMGFKTLKTIIESKKNVVDISFFPENALDLNDLAQTNNVTAIVDCGVAPGMGNIILGKHNKEMEVEEFLCYVGGLPKERVKPFEYKAPFSPIDVIEEYTRPARYVENGNIITREALSDAEIIDFDKAGSLEAFNTDGLRSLIYTMPHIPNMKEKTLRFPGHIQLIKDLKKAGFFNEGKIKIGDTEISPLEFSSKILLDNWKLGDTEEEFTVMKIIVKGKENSKQVTYTYDLYDTYNPQTQTSSMARTTGYTATAVTNLLLENKINKKGVLPPELIGDVDGVLDGVLKYLEKRKVNYSLNSN